FVIHVAEMIVGADDVGEQLIPFQIAAVAKLGDESDRNSRDRSFDRHAGIHEREHSAAHAGHRAGAVRFHDLARDADGVTEILGAGNYRLERALGKRSMADLATAGAARPSGNAYAEWREAVMKQKTLRSFTAAIGVDILRFYDRRQRDESERLGFAALKNGRAMRARQDADFARDWTQVLITAAGHPL